MFNLIRYIHVHTVYSNDVTDLLCFHCQKVTIEKIYKHRSDVIFILILKAARQVNLCSKEVIKMALWYPGLAVLALCRLSRTPQFKKKDIIASFIKNQQVQ